MREGVFRRMLACVIILLLMFTGFSSVHAGSVVDESSTAGVALEKLKVFKRSMENESVFRMSCSGFERLSFKFYKDVFEKLVLSKVDRRGEAAKDARLLDVQHRGWEKLLSPTVFHCRWKPSATGRDFPSDVEAPDGWDLVVPDNYSSIQEAVDAAGPMEGYRIFVRNGVYYENVVIDKDGVVLHGESVEGTVIDGSGKGCVIYVSSSYNNVSGFTIRNGGVGSAAVKLDFSNGNQICHNVVTGNGGDGFLLYRSHANVIEGNWVVENGGCGLLLNFSCLGNTITSNWINGNGVDGVLLTGVCRSNLVAGNEIEGNVVGVRVNGGSEGNVVHHNCFVDNSLNAYDDSNNSWDDGVCEGNYWDDYTGVDADGDGIGDTPYSVPGGSNVDRFPLMNPPLMQTFSFSEQSAIAHKIYGRNPLGSSLGEVIVVPDDYPSIQEAVDHACDGDTILVKPGVYFENVVVNKTLSIVGDDAENTVVDGGGVGHVFTVVADGCNVSGFTMRNTSMGFAGVKVKSNYVVVRGNMIRDVGDGVNLAGSCGSVVDGNVMSGCNFGVYCDGFTSGWVVDNTITFNNDGVAMWMSSSIVFEGNTMGNNSYDGVLCLWCGGNELGGNSIVGSGDFGVEMFSSYDNMVEGNSVRNTVGWGVSLHKSSGNSIGNNTISGNTGGVSFWFHSGNNTVSGNIIADITGVVQVVGVLFDMSCGNVVSGNIIKDISASGLSGVAAGICLFDSCDNVVSGNTIDNTTGKSVVYVYGIIAGGSWNNTILGNTIKGITSAKGSAIGIWPIASDNNRFLGNTISISGGLAAYGINPLGSVNNSFLGNTISATVGLKGSACGIYSIVSCNDSFLGNTITTGAGLKGFAAGIFIILSSDNTVSGNTISSSAGLKGSACGIHCGGYNNVVSGNTISATAGLKGFAAGLTALVSLYNTISDNAISSGAGLKGSAVGIFLSTSFNNTISDNTISSGAGLKGSAEGIFLSTSFNNTISDNAISSGAGLKGSAVGIFLFVSGNNTISDNTIKDTSASGLLGLAVGIYLYISDYNTVSGNTIKDTSASGLLGSAYGITLLAFNNTLYHNNFINNLINAIDLGSNTWDNGYPSGGNYWDDYTGRDADGDGIGDTPYRILGGNVDRYPLMKPWGMG